jgi:hypothetical protein
MKRITACIAAATALAVAAPALAQGYYQGGWTSIDRRQAQIDRRIDMGLRNGDLTRDEAFRLRGQIRDLARLEVSYRRNGLTNWERADLDRRFDRLSYQVMAERRDNDRRYSYGYGYDQGYYR